MNKAQLIDTLAGSFDGNRKAAAQALDTVLETITRTVVTGEKVGITGFGVFEKLDKPARTVRNPATGASVKKKKTSVPRFRAGAELKAYVSGDKKFARIPAVKKATPAAVKAAATTFVSAAAKAGAPAKATTRSTPAKATKVASATKTAAAAAPARAATTRTTPTKAAATKSATKTATKTATKVPAAKSTPTEAPAKRSAAKTTATKASAVAPAKTTRRAANKA